MPGLVNAFHQAHITIAKGGQWHPAVVRNVLKRLAALSTLATLMRHPAFFFLELPG
jgi:hypothetical protein